MRKSRRLIIESQLTSLNRVQAWFNHFYVGLEPELSWVKRHGDRLNIAVAEGFTNAVRHAHADLPPETPIIIEVNLESDRITIHIWDRGQPFDPNQLTEPQPGSLLCNGGYGWFLLRRAVDRAAYQRRGRQNCLEITQYRSRSPDPR